MPNTYVALATQTLGSATATVTFSSIPQGYTDLVLVISAKSTGSVFFNDNFFVTFNGDSATNYSRTRITGNGSTATSGRGLNDPYAVFGQLPNATSGNSANDRSANITSIMNYSNTTTFKTVLSRSNAIPSGSTSTNSVEAYVNLWRSTAAITSMSITSSAGNLDTGSTFSLYGIKTANAGLAKATGGTITFDGNGNVIHTFTSSGTFTPLQSLTCDYLVVAGGGAGSVNVGGGGGAGGYLTGSTSVTATGYTVTIGAGGAKAAYPTKGANGDNSVFGSITATGGGAGAVGGVNNSGSNGGSGGGGGSNGAGFISAGSASPSGQGNNGGIGSTAGGAGGGGGANAVGAAAFSTGSGAGGAGLSSSITGTAVTRGGGGGGGGGTASNYTVGAGGSGGGAAGGNFADAINATANTGGGGGGGGVNLANTIGYAASNGGSGIVIIRYPG